MFGLNMCDCSIPSPVSGVISLFEGSNIGDSACRRPSVFPEGVLGKMSSVESELDLDLAIKKSVYSNRMLLVGSILLFIENDDRKVKLSLFLYVRRMVGGLLHVRQPLRASKHASKPRTFCRL